MAWRWREWWIRNPSSTQTLSFIYLTPGRRPPHMFNFETWKRLFRLVRLDRFQMSHQLTLFIIVRCGPVCQFQKETCPKAPVLWKGMKYSKLLYGAVGAVQLRLTILNNQKDVVDIRTERFTAFLMVFIQKNKYSVIHFCQALLNWKDGDKSDQRG